MKPFMQAMPLQTPMFTHVADIGIQLCSRLFGQPRACRVVPEATTSGLQGVLYSIALLGRT